MKLTSLEMQLIIEAVNQIAVADNPDVDDFISDNELTDASFDNLTLCLRDKLSRLNIESTNIEFFIFDDDDDNTDILI